MLNQVVLVGRLCEDPQMTNTENGKQKTTVTVAVNRFFKNSEGLYETDFIRCVLWNGIAANTTEYCHKGDVVGIKGRIQVSSYEIAEQEKKYITEVIAEKVTFLSTNSKSEEQTKE